MSGWGRRAVPALMVTLLAGGCALLASDETAECATVRVSFEEAVDRLGPIAEGDGDDSVEVAYDEDALRDLAGLHDRRRECFGREHREFLDPALDQLDDDWDGAVEP